MKKISLHTILITAIIFSTIQLGTFISQNFSLLNPFKRIISDYEFTEDIIYSRFQNQVQFDDRIVIINSKKPNRKKITSAIEKINNYHPKAIGIDVVFNELKDSLIDQRLKLVIEENPNIVLADQLNDLEQNVPQNAHPYFGDATNFAFINFIAKKNQSIRFFSPREYINHNYIQSFGARIVSIYDASRFAKLEKRNKVIEQINYRGNQDSYTQIDIDDLLGKKDFSEAIKNKIVLMGYMGIDHWSDSHKDKFYTPLNKTFGAKSSPDMFGVVIHANILSMILDSDYITTVPLFLTKLLSIAILIILITWLRKFYLDGNAKYWKTVRLMQLGTFFGLFVLASMLFYFFRIKIDLFIALAGTVIAWDLVKFYEITRKKIKQFLYPNTN